MKAKTVLIAIMLLFAGMLTSKAQEKNVKAEAIPKEDSASASLLKPQKSVTQGSVTVEGKNVNYNAIAGTLILKNNDEKPTCSMFYVAYFKTDADESQRPLTFIYNGGPGSSTLWLHMGAWGPQRAVIKDTERILPPYKTVNNEYSLLDASDLVFIDAPGTGFSRLITKDKGGAGEPKDFYGIDPDAQAFASFITQFLSAYNRWDSPKYLFGESYGTFRSAALSYILETKDAVDLNGVILLSQLLSYNYMSDIAVADPGMCLPYELALPSAAATAWYFHKAPGQPEALEPFLKEVEHFAMNDYALALNKGSLLDTATFTQIAEKIHDYTGLPVTYIRKADLRVSGPMFEKMMLADENKITGRLDTRFTGLEMDPLSERPGYDPHSATFEAAFAGAFNNYVRTKLKFGRGMIYGPEPGSVIRQWDFRHLAPNLPFPLKIFANVMPDLAEAMIYNPRLKVMLNMGYFDLGTPFFEGEYEMHHLQIPAPLQQNVEFEHYYSGHMVYLHLPALQKLHDNVAKFIERTH